MTDTARVLVVGAGPVGLALASELARHGIAADIVDKASGISPFCRAIGITPRTLEVFEDMGVAREIVDAGLQLVGRRMLIWGDGKVARRDEQADLDDLPYSQIGVPQNRTEAVLGEHLRRFGIEVRRDCRLASLKQMPDAVEVEFDDGGQARTARYDYVVGCDGAHSAVRKALGLAFEGEAFPFDFMLGDVHVDWDLPRGMSLQAIRPVENAAPDFFVAIPLPDRGRYRVSAMAPVRPGSPNGEGSDHGIQADRPGATLADLQVVADRLLPEPARLFDLRWSSIFRISMRLAERYRVGRVLIAGDACHIHPPTGGQGMNTGIQDAYNLAWKLALVMQGAASNLLLDSYEAERRPVAGEVIAETVRRSVNFGKPEPPPHRLSDTQLLVSYRGGPLARGERFGNLSPGDRMPDIEGLRRRGFGFPLRLFDLLKGTGFVVMARLADADVRPFEGFMQRLRDAHPVPIRAIAVVPAGAKPDDAPGIEVVEDGGNGFGALLGTDEPLTLLIRPDNYIGMIRLGRSEEGVLSYLRDCLGG